MALEKRKFSEIPPDAVMLTEQEAIQYQSRILQKWKNPSDVFAYKYGSTLLGTATILSGIYFNNYFRTKYKLIHYGRIASYLPICAIPATLAALFHHELVLKQLLLLKQEQCPICMEMRAAVVQAGAGCLMPLILSPITSIGLVHRFGTFNMPFITKEPLEVLKLLRKQIKPIKNVLLGIFIGQALLASAVTYFEADSIYKVKMKLTRLEEELQFAANS